MVTGVKMKCVLKTTELSGDKKVSATTVRLRVPLNALSNYSKLFQGTTLLLNTTSKLVADMFKNGDEYDMFIVPSEYIDSM